MEKNEEWKVESRECRMQNGCEEKHMIREKLKGCDVTCERLMEARIIIILITPSGPSPRNVYALSLGGTKCLYSFSFKIESRVSLVVHGLVHR